MNPNPVSCKGCKKKVTPYYDIQKIQFFCPKCSKQILVDDPTFRRISVIRVACNVVFLLLVLCAMLVINNYINSTVGIIFALICIPFVSRIDRHIINIVVIKRGNYSFRK